jgi:hypothetical protein
MTKTMIVIRKRVEGQVLYNDGEFSEIQTNGIEGIEEGLLLNKIQTHREDTSDTPEEFQRRFPIGMWVDIMTITEITPVLDQERNSRCEYLQ